VVATHALIAFGPQFVQPSAQSLSLKFDQLNGGLRAAGAVRSKTFLRFG
jgi:hypothetical protein